MTTQVEPVTEQVAAFFDFDGTVSDGYSAVALLKDRARRGRIGPTEAVRLTLAGLGALTGRADVEDVMKAGLLAFQGRPMAELDQMGEELTRTVLGGYVFPEVVALMAAHRRQGHLIVIASSALPFQVEPLARELGVDHVLCTRLRERQAICTGELDGEALWGKAKSNAVRELAQTVGIDLQQSYAYANGDEDIDFLETVGHPLAVNPGKGLESIARERDWPIERFAPRANPGILAAPRTVAAYGGLAVSTCVGATLGLLNRSRRLAANLTFSLGSEVALSLAGVTVNVVGEQNLWSQRPAVFIFNHQSLLDPLIVLKLLQRDFTSVGKKEISRQPGLAQFAWLVNAALVERTDAGKAKEALAPVLERLSESYSIAIAPEGTRSITSRVGRFKKGPFHLAMQGGVPLVPIIIRNSGELQWRGSNVIRSGQVDVIVLPPISVKGWQVADLDARVADVHARYVDALDDWEAATAGDREPGVVSRANRLTQ